MNMGRALILLLLATLLAACGTEVEDARREAKAQQLPPTETQLLTLIKQGDDAGALLLVQAGVNPDAHQANGMTALMSAIFNNTPNTARALVDKGARLEPVAGGFDALGLAVEKGDKDMMRLLLLHGADPNRVPEGGRSALARAAGRPDADALRAILLGQ